MVTGVPVEEERILCITADDLGMCRGGDEAIVEGHLRGVITSASLILNYPNTDKALDKTRVLCPNLGIGVHLSLTAGKPLSNDNEIRRLIDRGGYFRHGFVSLAFNLHRDKLLRDQVRTELFRQLDFAYSKVGNLDHINGQCHIHMIPEIMDILVDEYFNGQVVTPVRRSWDIHILPRTLKNWFKAVMSINPAKASLLRFCAIRNEHHFRHIPTTDYYTGVANSGLMNIDEILGSAMSIPKGKSMEISVHPKKRNLCLLETFEQEFVRKHCCSQAVQKEFESVTDSVLRNGLKEQGTRIASMKSIAGKL